MAASAPRSAELFAEWGFDPVVVDIGEFEKMEGCVTCLSVLVGPVPSR
jgi:dimethylargininase